MPDERIFEKKEPIRNNRNPNLKKFQGKVAPNHFIPLSSRPDSAYRAMKTMKLELRPATMSCYIQLRPTTIDLRIFFIGSGTNLNRSEILKGQSSSKLNEEENKNNIDARKTRIIMDLNLKK